MYSIKIYLPEDKYFVTDTMSLQEAKLFIQQHLNRTDIYDVYDHENDEEISL